MLRAAPQPRAQRLLPGGQPPPVRSGSVTPLGLGKACSHSLFPAFCQPNDDRTEEGIFTPSQGVKKSYYLHDH